MRQHLLRSLQIEEAIRDKLVAEGAEFDSAKRVLVDLIGIRIATLERLIGDLEAEALRPFAQAMERIRQHFDKDCKEPYRTFRGPTPKDEPSLPKDIVVVFEELVARCIWNGPVPVRDPRWDPS